VTCAAPAQAKALIVEDERRAAAARAAAAARRTRLAPSRAAPMRVAAPASGLSGEAQQVAGIVLRCYFETARSLSLPLAPSRSLTLPLALPLTASLSLLVPSCFLTLFFLAPAPRPACSLTSPRVSSQPSILLPLGESLQTCSAIFQARVPRTLSLTPIVGGKALSSLRQARPLSFLFICPVNRSLRTRI
jgi:hypothetical protein